MPQDLATVEAPPPGALVLPAVELAFPLSFGVVTATVVPYRVGDEVHVDTTVDGPDGPVKINASCDVATFGKWVDRAEKLGTFLKIKTWLLQRGVTPEIKGRTVLGPGGDVDQFMEPLFPRRFLLNR
jgi:hypothetical protein